MAEDALDLRGKACPIPVVETRKHLLAQRGATRVEVWVDNTAAAENVSRMARSLGYAPKVDAETAERIVLVLEREGSAAQNKAATNTSGAQTEDASAPQEAACRIPEKVVVLVGAERMGRGDAALGEILMRAFLQTVKELVPRPKVLIFLNGGVRLTTKGSKVLAPLRELAEAGVEVLSCGTCLDFFDLQEALAVGAASNMFEIASHLVTADRLVQL
jgi:selenium metabolism protein YedF